MNSKRAGGKIATNSRGKGADVNDSGRGSSTVAQLNKDMANVGLESQDDGWELCARKSKNKTGGAASKDWDSSVSSSKAWGHAETVPRQVWGANGGAGQAFGNYWPQANESRKPGGIGRGNNKQQASSKNWESHYMAPPPVVPPPLQHGWQWAARGGLSGPKTGEPDADTVPKEHDEDTDDEDDDLVDDSEGDISDDYDSDVSQKSYETRKNSKWFRGFFAELDKLTVEEINETSRQWHCPACHNAPGAIDWYKGLQPLMTHAKTKGSTRVKLHRELASLLEEELHLRGTSVVTSGEVFGKWKGLKETTDHEIVWPPMVVIMNTLLEQDENDKWIGMGKQELLDYFKSYAAVNARHSYGPNGHRGMSVLIFEGTAMGYLEAERLHKHFTDQGTNRDAWDGRRRMLFSAGGKRQLYGYLACKEDMDAFNQHCQGKSRLKYDMRSYQEMVVIPLKQMSEESQKVTWLKKRSKALEENFGIVSQKLRETMEDNRIVRLRTKIQYEENKEEMDFQESFFKVQMDKIHEATEEKEKRFEKMLQDERTKAKNSDTNCGTGEEQRLRTEKFARFVNNQVKGVEEFEAEREKLIQAHEEKKLELRRNFLKDEIKMEQEFESALTKLMEKYSPSSFEASNSVS